MFNKFLTKAALGAGLFAILISTNVSAAKLDLSEGTMTITGRAQVAYAAADITKLGDFYGDVAFGFGGFVADNFMIDGRIMAGGAFNTTGNTTNFWIPNRHAGLGVGLTYFFQTDSMIRPYLGVGIYGMWKQIGAATTSIWSIGARPELGLLVGLNSHVALDFGINAVIDIPLAGTAGVANPTSLWASAGHVGVRAFF